MKIGDVFYLIRSWCLKPCRSPEILERRYDVIQFFLDPNQHELMRTLRDHLKPIVNIPVIKLSFQKKTNKRFIYFSLYFEKYLIKI